VTDEDDGVIVRRCLAGDRESFGAIVDRYQRPLFNVALRMLGDREEARDATQTAFVKAWRGLSTYRPEHKFFSWIYRILINQALTQRSRRRPAEALHEDLPTREASPEERLEQSERDETIREALATMSLEHRQVIVLRHFLQQSYEEMGEMLGIPAKTVKSRLFTARRVLGAELMRRGVRSS
jgi:RNA polymerase sigma-70 factor (ECF subfamily)